MQFRKLREEVKYALREEIDGFSIFCEYVAPLTVIPLAYRAIKKLKERFVSR